MAKKHKILAAARARAGRWHRQPTRIQSESTDTTITNDELDSLPASEEIPDIFGTEFSPIELDLDCLSDCEYTGGVNTMLPSDSEYETDPHSDFEEDGMESDLESLCELEGNELDANLAAIGAATCVTQGSQSPPTTSMHNELLIPKTMASWKKAERNRALGYNGHSERTQRRRDKEARDRAEKREKLKNSNEPQVAWMRQWCSKQPPQRDVRVPMHTEVSEPPLAVPVEPPVFTGYLSDQSDDDIETDSDRDTDNAATHTNNTGLKSNESTRLPAVPPLKRHKLDIPYRMQRKLAHEQRTMEMKNALTAMEKLRLSKKTHFINGPNGLQAKQACAIESYLCLIIKNGRTSIDASKRAAESHGFAADWGSRQLRSWTRAWISERKLPTSWAGRHAKVYSLLNDPAIAGELRTYVRSSKWAINPDKLTEFSKNKLIPAEAEEYLRGVVDNKIPQGLKRYMELELFPRVHLKVGRGISLATARRWLRHEGFRYTSHKKGLYFDGHDRADRV
ncbi:hypothetical protein BJ138DRAFT_1120921 [Hygrophoropsis aurantiaca]|uniref:Uncharacterized protein n=1 Tax=Hygrophoropsis aurantiaca TaxID=72124 RepID=A0ACB7ZQ07_9AGAM|nr:hypothetical protein BJ138DRAFT_1120921 [Hygrophoropsis aurantiaca]